MPEWKAKECYLWLQRLCSSSFWAFCKTHTYHKCWSSLIETTQFHGKIQHKMSFNSRFPEVGSLLDHERLPASWFGSPMETVRLGWDLSVSVYSIVLNNKNQQWSAKWERRKEKGNCKGTCLCFPTTALLNATIRNWAHSLSPQYGKHPFLSKCRARAFYQHFLLTFKT